MHHDARWFSLPERFHPERFLPEAAAAFPSRAHVPFGAGSRSCLGQGFAMLEAVLVIAQVLQRFRLELSDSHPVFCARASRSRRHDRCRFACRHVMDSRHSH